MYKTVSKNRANLGFYFHKFNTTLQLCYTSFSGVWDGHVGVHRVEGLNLKFFPFSKFLNLCTRPQGRKMTRLTSLQQHSERC